MFIEGQQSGAITIRQQGVMKSVGITMYPWAASYFYQVLPVHFTNNNFSAETLDVLLADLYNLLAENNDNEMIPVLCDQYFLARLRIRPVAMVAADRLMITIINKFPGSIRPGALKKEWGFSDRYFEQKCLQLTGMPATAMVKKRKMKNALTKCLGDSFISFTDVAYSCGYYDQSHFIKDFKYFFQQSPAKVFRQKDFFLPDFM